jgi:TolB-like protein
MKKIICLIILVVIIPFSPLTAAQENASVIAIVPFANLTKNTDLDWLSEGIVETLTTKLAHVKTIQIVERQRLDAALNEISLGQMGVVDEQKAARAGQMVGAETVVTGAYQQVGDTLRLTARFVKVATGIISNTAMATGSYSDLFSLEDKIADDILSTLGVRVSSAEKEKIYRKPTTSVDAYKNYSQGLNYIKKARYDDAKIMFDRALTKDPDFSQAREDLAFVQWARPSANSSLYLERINRPFDETFNTMLAAVQRAGMEVRSAQREQGTLEVHESSWGLTKSPQDIQIEIKRLKTISGVRIFSQPSKVPCLGMRQVYDWGQSKKTIEKLIAAFESELYPH